MYISICKKVIEFFKNYAYLIELKYTPRLDYIKIIDKIIESKDVDKNEN